jgi:hypothetical protein
VQDRVLDAAELAKRKKYQDESTKVSIVSVSRRAGRSQRGQRHSTNDLSLASGLPLPSGTRSSGSTTGRSWSGTGTSPQASQWISGIGHPQ